MPDIRKRRPVILSGAGTKGDFVNVLYLAARLQTRGHEVYTIVVDDLLGMARELHLANVALTGVKIDEALRGDPVWSARSRNRTIRTLRLFWLGGIPLRNHIAPGVFESLEELLQRLEDPIVIGNAVFLSMAAPMLQEFGVRTIIQVEPSIVTQPELSATRSMFADIPGLSIPNQHRLIGKLFGWKIIGPSRQLLYDDGYKHAPSHNEWMRNHVTAKILAFDPMFLHPNEKLPKNMMCRGFFFGSFRRDPLLEDRILDFLKGKKTAIFVSWGSLISDPEVAATLSETVRSILRRGVSVIMQLPSSLNVNLTPHENMLILKGYASHDHILDLMRRHLKSAAYMGSTGAGITALCLRHAIPVLAPIGSFSDQDYWSKALEEFGMCVVYKPAEFDQAIEKVLSEFYQDNAMRCLFDLKMDGLEQATLFVEEYI